VGTVQKLGKISYWPATLQFHRRTDEVEELQSLASNIRQNVGDKQQSNTQRPGKGVKWLEGPLGWVATDATPTAFTYVTRLIFSEIPLTLLQEKGHFRGDGAQLPVLERQNLQRL
jgi:hypothetical protein